MSALDDRRLAVAEVTGFVDVARDNVGDSNARLCRFEAPLVPNVD